MICSNKSQTIPKMFCSRLYFHFVKSVFLVLKLSCAEIRTEKELYQIYIWKGKINKNKPNKCKKLSERWKKAVRSAKVALCLSTDRYEIYHLPIIKSKILRCLFISSKINCVQKGLIFQLKQKVLYIYLLSDTAKLQCRLYKPLPCIYFKHELIENIDLSGFSQLHPWLDNDTKIMIHPSFFCFINKTDSFNWRENWPKHFSC